MVGNIDKEVCTGCKMCADICPQNAISFEEDREGFWYPVVNEEKCNKCGLCKGRCPSLNDIHMMFDKEPEVYACWSKDDNVRISSTSGGVFWVFAEAFIRDGGYVVGCKYGEDWKSAVHFMAGNMEELEKLKGSKYFQSDTADIYRKVKEKLVAGAKVLFCGTPCQNIALYSYLGREYNNLFYMDFICRSINSPKAFRAYIEELETEYSSNAIKVQLKNKNTGWQSLASFVEFENGKSSHKDRYQDFWVKGFIENDLYTRHSCYHCKYKKIPRVSADITIGDFWGIQNQSSEDLFKGISVLLLNSEKGKSLWNVVKDNFVVQIHSIEEVIPGNPALLNNVEQKKKQTDFFKLLETTTFSNAVKICTKISLGRKVTEMIKLFVQKVRNFKYLFWDLEISFPKFLYYNYFCKNIIRKDKSRILPHKNAIINLKKNSKIILKGRDLEIGYNKLKGSKAETHIRLDEGAVWNCNNGGLLFYNTVLEVKEKALFDTGFFSANGGSVIIAHKKITFGEDVMIGRNVIIYDSDFHSILNKDHKAVNVARPVTIKDHVWLTTNVMVQKGVTIEKDSLISAYTVVNKDVPAHSVVGGNSIGKVVKDEIMWDRNVCPLE